MIIELKNQTLEQVFAQYNKVIVDIYATWCGPCQMLSTQLDAFSKKNSEWIIVRVDSDKHPDVAAKFAVQAVPTMIFVKDKKVQEIVVGFKPLIEIEKISGKY